MHTVTPRFRRYPADASFVRGERLVYVPETGRPMPCRVNIGGTGTVVITATTAGGYKRRLRVTADRLAAR